MPDYDLLLNHWTRTGTAPTRDHVRVLVGDWVAGRWTRYTAAAVLSSDLPAADRLEPVMHLTGW